MIRLEQVTYHYPQDLTPALADVNLEIPEGEFLLVTGPSGSGKSTLLRCLNGLVPHFYGGTFAGQIDVFGHDPVAEGPREMSRLVGLVFQDPESQQVATRVEDEIVFAMENHGLPEVTMRKRVEEVLDQLGIAHLRGRRLDTLSGGERQRVAIAAVLTLQPRLLVLDEPTSQLDPQGAEEVLDNLLRLNRDLGLTVVLSEHRLERVVHHADRILYLPGSTHPPLLGTPREVLERVELAPPLVVLGKALGWQPLPLTVREARRFVHTGDRKGEAFSPAGARSSPTMPSLPGNPVEAGCENASPLLAAPPDNGWHKAAQSTLLSAPSAVPSIRAAPLRYSGQRLGDGKREHLGQKPAGEDAGRSKVGGQLTDFVPILPPNSHEPAVRVEGVCFSYNGRPSGLAQEQAALRDVHLEVGYGEVVVLMGRNGSGKTTLLKQIVGLLRPQRGQVVVAGLDTRHTALERIIERVGYVPQNPNALLFADTVQEEIEFTLRQHGRPVDAHGELPSLLGLEPYYPRYPRDLSVGERQRVALAAVLVTQPDIILLDEPTRGMDYVQKDALVTFLRQQRGQGRAIILATHDVELVARCADRVILLGEGEVLVDGPVREVMTGSLTFSSQINRLYRDPRYLTVEDVLSMEAEPCANEPH